MGWWWLRSEVQRDRSGYRKDRRRHAIGRECGLRKWPTRRLRCSSGPRHRPRRRLSIEHGMQCTVLRDGAGLLTRPVQTWTSHCSRCRSEPLCARLAATSAPVIVRYLISHLIGFQYYVSYLILNIHIDLALSVTSVNNIAYCILFSRSGRLSWRRRLFVYSPLPDMTPHY